MSLTAGSRLGPYEIVALIGAGGMGEVYRAHDGRLGRDVALKVLAPAFAADPGRRRRFSQEARAASALADPHIVSVFDVGEQDGILYFACELVEGGDLRDRIPAAGLPVRKALEWAAQIAGGLAAAHDKGIVHRDLKPENVLLTPSGEAKIADFGLAKLTEPSDAELSQLPTADRVETTAGVVMGTVAYMSPEQAAGRAVDFRTAQFALGAILYELLPGRAPFRRETKGESLAAILRDEPPPLLQARPEAPAPLSWIVDRCLAKDPNDRYSSTRDLARDLAGTLQRISEISRSDAILASETSGGRPSRSRRRIRLAAAGAALAVLGAAAGILATAGLWTRPPPAYRPLSFRKGLITGAKFSPDGRTVYYSAAFGVGLSKLFMTRLDSAESAPIDLPPAMLLSVSRRNELAILLTTGRNIGNTPGTLARASALGGAPRPLADNVLDADWAPDGENLAVCRDDYRIEFPLGHPLGFEGQMPRVSPAGDRVAWIGDDGVSIYDVKTKRRIRSAIPFSFGIAWRPDGREVWFTGSESGGGSDRAIYALSLSGKRRLVARAPGAMTILDVGPGGKSALLFTGSGWNTISVKPPGAQAEHEISLFGRSALVGLSEDGTRLLANEYREVAHGAYLCSTDGNDIVRLGDMTALGLSPDGKWVLGFLPADASRLRMWPTGAGIPRDIPLEGRLRAVGDIPAKWSLSARGPFVSLMPPDDAARRRIFLLEGGKLRPVTPEGVAAPYVVSPDGSWIAANDRFGSVTLYSTGGAAARKLEGETGLPVHWSNDGKWLYLRTPNLYSVPLKVYRREISTGRIEPWREIGPSDLSGITYVGLVFYAHDEAVYAYRYSRAVNELYLATGLN